MDYDISRDPEGRYFAFETSDERPRLVRDQHGAWKFASWEALEAAMNSESAPETALEHEQVEAQDEEEVTALPPLQIDRGAHSAPDFNANVG